MTVLRSKFPGRPCVGDGNRSVWFGAPGFEILSVVDGSVTVTIEVETTAALMVCARCGERAWSKGRRWVELADTPSGSASVKVRWRKRIWQCVNEACETKSWTETASLAGPREVITRRAQVWATDRVGAIEATVASLARTLGVSWSTVWAAVIAVGGERVDDSERVGTTAMIGFDETVMQPASRRRRRRFITACVDVETSQVIDVFEGHNSADLSAWMGTQDPGWLAGIGVVSVDPHEGYRHAICADNSPLRDCQIVVDPFHIVRLANQAVTKARQRVQNETLGHRGWKGDPLYAIRKLLLMGAERIDDAGWDRLHTKLRRGDTEGHVTDCWIAKEKVRDIYLTEDPAEAKRCLDAAIAWCDSEPDIAELATLAKTLRRWSRQIVARHYTGASNGPVEAANLTIKQVKRSGRGFRNFTNYRLRILLATGLNPCHTQPVTRIRTRTPSLVA